MITSYYTILKQSGILRLVAGGVVLNQVQAFTGGYLLWIGYLRVRRMGLGAQLPHHLPLWPNILLLGQFTTALHCPRSNPQQLTPGGGISCSSQQLTHHMAGAATIIQPQTTKKAL